MNLASTAEGKTFKKKLTKELSTAQQAAAAEYKMKSLAGAPENDQGKVTSREAEAFALSDAEGSASDGSDSGSSSDID